MRSFGQGRSRGVGLAGVLALASAAAWGQSRLGIGGYDLSSTADRIVAFDYDSSGKQDHLLLYRPGTGTIWILKNTGGRFAPVFASSNGIGGYDLSSTADVILRSITTAQEKRTTYYCIGQGREPVGFWKTGMGRFLRCTRRVEGRGLGHTT